MTSRRLGLAAVGLVVVGVVVLSCTGGEQPTSPPAAAVPTGSVPTGSVPPGQLAAEPAGPAATRPPSTTEVVQSSSGEPVVSEDGLEVPDDELVAPALRQRPQLAAAPDIDPATVAVVPAPVGVASVDELATPTAAAAAWAARWCPFTHTDDLGVAESRARSAMTPAGWASFDPRQDPVAVGAWAGVTAAGLTGTCSAPDVVISPEAPRSPVAAYVSVTLRRVLTPTTGPTTVETVTTTRLVLREQDRWLVDSPAQAG